MKKSMRVFVMMMVVFAYGMYVQAEKDANIPTLSDAKQTMAGKAEITDLPAMTVSKLPGEVDPAALGALPQGPKVAQSPVSQVPAVASDIAGAETVELSEQDIGAQGNWVKKREWLKEAQKANTKVQDLVVAIQKSRKSFHDKFNTIDGELDLFYKQEGLEQGKAGLLFSDLLRYIEKYRRGKIQELQDAGFKEGTTGDYEIKLDIIEEQVRGYKVELDQLKLDLKSISDLDKSLNDRLSRLDKHIGSALDESSKSRELSDKIWYIIDDKKARDVYYDLRGTVLGQVQAIENYIKKDLTNDFDQVLKTAHVQMKKVRDGIQTLEDKGLMIRNRVERVKELKVKQLEEAKIKERERSIAKKKKRKVVSVPFYMQLYTFFIDLFARAYNTLKRFFGIQDVQTKKEMIPDTMPGVEQTTSSEIIEQPKAKGLPEEPTGPKASSRFSADQPMMPEPLKPVLPTTLQMPPQEAPAGITGGLNPL